MGKAIADRIKIIDTDTHVTEPADLWTSRVSKKWGDLIPHKEETSKGMGGWVTEARSRPGSLRSVRPTARKAR